MVLVVKGSLQMAGHQPHVRPEIVQCSKKVPSTLPMLGKLGTSAHLS